MGVDERGVGTRPAISTAIESAMRRIWITKAGPPDVLAVREERDPEPGASQIRVRVRAAGVNFADLMARAGLYPDAPRPPCVVGYEVAGVVDQVGADVTAFQPGDRVLAMPRFGGYTDTLVVDASQVLPMPERMTFEHGAALPVAYLTAHHSMVFTGNLRQGSRVLVHSAAGGVGLAAVQIARSRACEVFGIAARAKHDFLREQGVAHPIDSAERDYASVVRSIAGERGVDLVLDPVGGVSWSVGLDLLAPAGRLVVLGFSGALPGARRSLVRVAGHVLRTRRLSPIALMNGNKTVTGVNMGHLFGHAELFADQFRSLLAMYEAGRIAPHIDRSFPFDQAPAAHQHLHDRKAVGKVLLVP